MKHFILAMMVLFIFPMTVIGDSLKFDPLYNNKAECFMSLNYEGIEGPAPKYWKIKDAVYKEGILKRDLVFVRIDGNKWYKQRKMLTIAADKRISCFDGNTIDATWLCPEYIKKIMPVVKAPIEKRVFYVYFDFNKSNIKDEQVPILKAAVDYAKLGGTVDIKLETSCDFRGSVAYNFKLGEDRADAVALWFADNGLDLPISVDNYGEKRSMIRSLVNGVFCPDCWADRKVKVTVD